MFKRFCLFLSVLFLVTSCGIFRPHMATTHPVGPRVATACAKYVLPFHIGGENTILAAAKKGKIRNVSTVDTAMKGFFPFYYKRCTTISGK
jgi:hypothetical protein